MNMNIKTFSALMALLSSGVSYAACTNVTANIQSLTPDSRYEYSAGGAEVTDKQTGLVWQRCGVGNTFNDNSTPSNFTDDQCDGPPLTETNWGAIFNSLPAGWRVPNVKELASLVAIECNNPSINVTAFPNASTDAQWSSSPDVNDAESAWAVSFSSGLAQTTKKNTNTSYRLVKIQ